MSYDQYFFIGLIWAVICVSMGIVFYAVTDDPPEAEEVLITASLAAFLSFLFWPVSIVVGLLVSVFFVLKGIATTARRIVKGPEEDTYNYE